MKKDRVSIITLAYNNLQYAKECLNSVLCQTYEDIEWLFFDDESDNYWEYEKEIKKILSKENKENIQNVVMHHNSVNLGVVKNYESALEAATGEYIFYLAVDDILYDENVIKDVVEFFHKTDADIFTGCMEELSADGASRILPQKHEIQYLQTESLDKILQRHYRNNKIAGACTPFRKSLVDKYGFVEEGYVHLEDWPRYINLMEHGIRIHFYDRILIKYRIGGITDEITNEDLKNDFRKLNQKYMNAPYSNILEAMRNRKYIIGWGASGGFSMWYKKWEEKVNREIDFIIDKNPEKAGTVFCEKKVYLPDVLEKIPREERYVLVFSSTYYIEIADELECMGMQEGKDFDLIDDKRIL